MHIGRRLINLEMGKICNWVYLMHSVDFACSCSFFACTGNSRPFFGTFHQCVLPKERYFAMFFACHPEFCGPFSELLRNLNVNVASVMAMALAFWGSPSMKTLRLLSMKAIFVQSVRIFPSLAQLVESISWDAPED